MIQFTIDNTRIVLSVKQQSHIFQTMLVCGDLCHTILVYDDKYHTMLVWGD